MNLVYPITFQDLPDDILGEVEIYGIYSSLNVIESQNTVSACPPKQYKYNTFNTWASYGNTEYITLYSVVTQSDNNTEEESIYKQIDGCCKYSLSIKINELYQHNIELLRKIVQHELIHIYCILEYSYFEHGDKFQEIQDKFGIYSIDDQGNKDYQYFRD